MLRLILLQYFDVTDEEILYIVTDRPDPRCVAGTKPTNTIHDQRIDQGGHGPSRPIPTTGAPQAGADLAAMRKSSETCAAP